ncbi:MAG: hypothetical protein GX640_06470 [Fibrobacter sp.]|nr:hypothetical protein [Fibrobacter sp.]
MNRLIGATIILLQTFFISLYSQNLLTNGSFENSTGWSLYVNPEKNADAELSFPTTGAQDGNRFARVTVTAISDLNWHIQLQDPAWTCKKGVEYHLSFYAKADANRAIQVAVSGDSTSPYTYRSGTELSVGTEWKKFDIYYKSDVEGSNATSFNFYCGYAIGVYDFDNVIIEENSITLPSTITLPAQSAWESKTHRNLFAELGYSQAQIDDKINSAFQQLFFSDHATEAVYTPVEPDLGFINQPGSGSIITEGQSYGMMIALQMNRQDVFDRLWKFAYTYMLHHSGDRKGMFSWKVNETSPYAMIDPNPAPDGEEYFVTALLFAAKRWGNKEGIFNYQKQADSILTTLLHMPPNNTVVPEIDSEHAMIVFSPVANGTLFTDPSYHLPAFYSVWEKYASADNAFWKRMADSSRAFFKRASHPVTGLSSDYAAFDGTPYPISFNRFAGWYHSDSWRTPMNIAVDYAWCKADPWQVEQTVRTLKFFDSQTGDYLQTYNINGTPESESETEMVTYNASPGQIACNAVAALASNDPVAWKFVDRLWKLPMVTGEWRYYSGLLTMMGLLHVSGNFKIWGNVTSNSSFKPEKVKPVQSFVKGAVTILDLSGKVVAKMNIEKAISIKKLKDQLIRSRIDSTNNVFIIKFTGENGKIITQQISIVR